MNYKIVFLLTLGLSSAIYTSSDLHVVADNIFNSSKPECLGNTPCAFAYKATDQDTGFEHLKVFSTWCRCRYNQICSFDMITPTNIYRYICNDG